jgi:hypothetical protein
MKETDSFIARIPTPCIYYYANTLICRFNFNKMESYGYHKYTPQLDRHYRACENKILFPVAPESPA